MVPVLRDKCTWPAAAARWGSCSAYASCPLATIQAKTGCTPCRFYNQGGLVPDSSRHWPRPGSICTSSSNDAASAAEQPVPLKSRSERSLQSLDSLLGEELERSSSTAVLKQDTAAKAQLRAQPLSKSFPKALKSAGIYPADVAKLEPPKVRPIFSFVFYYWHIVIFAAGFYLNDVDGPGAGDDFLDVLTNDHLLVTQGHELWRVLTCAFVHPNPWALFITLMAVGALGWELEASMGYVAFGAASLATAIITSTVELAADQLPVTHGSLPMIASLVGSLLVLYSRDSALQEQVKALQANGPVSASTASQRATSNASKAPHSRHSQGGEASTEQRQQSMSQLHSNSATTGPERNHMQTQPASSIAQRSTDAASSRDSEEEAEVEFLEGIVKVSVATSSPLKAAATISTGALAAVEALYDLKQAGSLSSDWWGIAAGFITGLAFAWVLLPNYTVQKLCLSSAVAQVIANRQRSPLRLPWFSFGVDTVLQQVQQQELARTSQQGGSMKSAPDVLLVQDSTSVSTKAGFVIVTLAAATGCLLHLCNYL